MGIYIFTISFVFISFLYFYKRPNYKYYNVIFAIVAFIICFGYMCGSDWRAYEEIYTSYNSPNGVDFWWRFLYVEPFYLLLNVIGNVLHLDFWIFYIALKLLIYYKIVYILKKFCPANLVLLAFTFYLGFWGIMNFIDISFRNMIAVYCFLCSIEHLLNKNLFKYLLWVLVATLFHYSSLILIVFYFLLNRTYSTRNIVVCFVLANIVLLRTDYIFELINHVFSFVPAIVHKVENYTTGEEAMTTGAGELLSFGYILHVFFFILILFSRRQIERLQYGSFLFNVSIIFVFIFRIGLTTLIFSRLQLFISYFYAIVIAYLIYSFASKFRLLYSFLIFFIALSSNVKQMARIWMVPYTNYLFYCGQDISFEDRSMYNFIHSPYKLEEK